MAITPFVHSNLTDYLKAVRENYGVRKKPISLKIWAERLGYKTARSLELVIAGDRLPSAQMAENLADDLQLNARERRYFLLLVRREKFLRENKSVVDIEKQLDDLRPPRTQMQFLNNEIFRRVAEWYPIVVRELMLTPGFKKDIQWIRKKLKDKLSSSQIIAAIAEWEGLALDRRTFYTAEDVPSEAVRTFHKKMLYKAIEAVDEVGVDEREYIAFTFKASPRKIAQMKTALREIRDQVAKDFDEDEGSEIFQFNMALFPHTELAK